MNNSLQEYLNFANKLADVAGITSMEYFRTSLSIDNKSDESPVTIADKNTELKSQFTKIAKLINKYLTKGYKALVVKKPLLVTDRNGVSSMYKMEKKAIL